jgi:hypothetical protein
MYNWMYLTRNEAPGLLFYEAQTTSASVGVGEAINVEPTRTCSRIGSTLIYRQILTYLEPCIYLKSVLAIGTMLTGID